jgi:hypothetical protein
VCTLDKKGQDLNISVLIDYFLEGERSGSKRDLNQREILKKGGARKLPHPKLKR